MDGALGALHNILVDGALGAIRSSVSAKLRVTIHQSFEMRWNAIEWYCSSVNILSVSNAMLVATQQVKLHCDTL